jgi:hypothetical protein
LGIELGYARSTTYSRAALLQRLLANFELSLTPSSSSRFPLAGTEQNFARERVEVLK